MSLSQPINSHTQIRRHRLVRERPPYWCGNERQQCAPTKSRHVQAGPARLRPRGPFLNTNDPRMVKRWRVRKGQTRTSPHARGYAQTRVAPQLALCGFGNLERRELRAKRALADPRALLRPSYGEADYRPVWLLIVSSTWALTASRLNEAGACIGGYSIADCANSVTFRCT
jgi:hypothetical protein